MIFALYHKYSFYIVLYLELLFHLTPYNLLLVQVPQQKCATVQETKNEKECSNGGNSPQRRPLRWFLQSLSVVHSKMIFLNLHISYNFSLKGYPFKFSPHFWIAYQTSVIISINAVTSRTSFGLPSHGIAMSIPSAFLTFSIRCVAFWFRRIHHSAVLIISAD